MTWDGPHYAVQSFETGVWSVRRFARRAAALRFARRESKRFHIGVAVARLTKDKDGSWVEETVQWVAEGTR